MKQTTTIYVNLLEEGTDTIRRTHALSMGDGLYKLLPAEDYNPEDEIWEFLPDSIVKAIPIKTFDGELVLLAVKDDSKHS